MSAHALPMPGIGIEAPDDLIGHDPLDRYQRLCIERGECVDPCALAVMISITRFMAGDRPTVWWAFTSERKNRFPSV